MALQALLFSKNPETVQSLTALLAEAAISTEVCADIFSAIEKAKQQTFQCIIADWVDQPESGFLIKRAHESAPNRASVALAVVDDEFTAKRAHENQIEFVLFRPIAADEARAVLANARQKMQLAPAMSLSTALAQAGAEDSAAEPEDPNLAAGGADLPESSQPGYEAAADEDRAVEGEDDEIFAERSARGGRSFRPSFRGALAASLVALALFCLWRGRASFLYLARTPEGPIHVLRQSLAALFYVNSSGAPPLGSAGTEARQDAYFSRGSNSPVTQPASVQVVAGGITIPETARLRRRVFDFPLPSPELVRAAAPPPSRTYAKVPESIRNSAPMTPALVVTVNPAQLLPVSTPPPPIPQVSEPVQLTEEAARATAVHVVEPVYPQEAMAQKLHGTVVLQVMIGRDGSVQDVKIVRGYFLLGRAGVAAVKAWRFRPYTFNGLPASVRTQITLNFSYPPA
jgi:TonB family protein